MTPAWHIRPDSHGDRRFWRPSCCYYTTDVLVRSAGIAPAPDRWQRPMLAATPRPHIRKIVGQEHNAATCGTQLLTCVPARYTTKNEHLHPGACRHGHWISRWTFRCFGHTSHEALRL